MHPPDIEKLNFKSVKPILICDADEVIFDFMNTFVNFLEKYNLKFIWRSYALDGNIVDKNNKAVDEKNVKDILFSFFKKNTLNMKLVSGAKESLNKISTYYNIIILSNIPSEFYKLRFEALESHNIHYPFFVNIGGKGNVCSMISERFKVLTWFIDDSPYQIASVKKKSQSIKTILYVQNKKLSKLINHKRCWDFFSDTWKNNEKLLIY